MCHLVSESCHVDHELEAVNDPGGSDLGYLNLATSAIGIQGPRQGGDWLHLDTQGFQNLLFPFAINIC